MVLHSGARQLTDLELMAHLFRRAGFGATRDELEVALKKGYEALVEELVHPEAQPDLDLDLLCVVRLVEGRREEAVPE